MAKYYSGISEGETLDSMLANGGTYGISPSKTIDCSSVIIDTNIGIGTDSPNTPFHLYHATTNGVALFESGDAYCNLILQDGNSNASSKPQFGVQGNDFRFVSHDGSSATEKLRIKSNGLVKGTLHTLIGEHSAATCLLYTSDAADE